MHLNCNSFKCIKMNPAQTHTHICTNHVNWQSAPNMYGCCLVYVGNWVKGDVFPHMFVYIHIPHMRFSFFFFIRKRNSLVAIASVRRTNVVALTLSVSVGFESQWNTEHTQSSFVIIIVVYIVFSRLVGLWMLLKTVFIYPHI